MAQWIDFIEDTILPDGEYFCIMQHENDLPEDGVVKDVVEFKYGCWHTAPGWTIVKYLSESSPASPEIERLKGLIEAAHHFGYKQQRWTMAESWNQFKTNHQL